MEVWRRQFALIVTLVMMALTASADSSAFSLFQDTARNKRQATCTIQYSPVPTSYCQGLATLSLVAYPGRTDTFVLCDSPYMHTILQCPPELPHFDAISRTCTIDTLLQQCGWTTNPCTSASLATGIYQFVCRNNPREYVSCDRTNPGIYNVLTCPASEVFDSQVGNCAVDSVLRQCGYTVNPCTYSTAINVPCPLSNTEYLACTALGTYVLHTCPSNEMFDSRIRDCAVDSALQQCGYTVNPCTFLTAINVYCPLSNTEYLACTSLGTYTLHTCPSNELFDRVTRICYGSQPSMCGLSVNPCTSLTSGNFACPESTTEYLACSTTSLLSYTIIKCPVAEVFSSSTKTCTNQIIHGFGDPCTAENIHNGVYFHPYSQDQHMYIQCDEWGGGYLKRCNGDFYYNPLSHTCVDGPVTSGSG